MISRFFYQVKPLIPRPMQLFLRRMLISTQVKKHRATWPIDPAAAAPPPKWKGWPEGKRFALVLTHDVESPKGVERCLLLAKLEESLDFRSSFNFVPERYRVPPELRLELVERGFEVGVHGLLHDGKYFNSRKIWEERAARVRHYLKEWNAVGYRSPSMLRNLEWFHDLGIEYDSSTFDTDPFEPQSDGVHTIFPFWVPGANGFRGYMELPYTLPQDFTLFILFGEQSIRVWKEKLDWLAHHGGMALINTHPDYMNFGSSRNRNEHYPADFYSEFLLYVKSKYAGAYWNVLPKNVAAYCSTASFSHLTKGAHDAEVEENLD